MAGTRLPLPPVVPVRCPLMPGQRRVLQQMLVPLLVVPLTVAVAEARQEEAHLQTLQL